MSDERWVVIVARNNLDLLKQSVASAQAQDVPVRVMVVDNGSAADVGSWLRCRRDVMSIAFQPQHSLSRAWNSALGYLFGVRGAERVLVINPDSVLRPDIYRWLENERAMFVTGVGSDDPASVQPRPPLKPMPLVDNIARSTGLYQITKAMAPEIIDRIERPFSGPWYPTPRQDATRPHPDFSCFMMSRECYARVGPFDERYQPAWFEDNDYHIRMHRAGITAYAIDLPFWHVGGGAQTLKRADEREARELSEAFARNRELFVSMYGCDPSNTSEYEKLFQ